MTEEERIKFLQEAFRRGYDVEAIHVESVPVVETFRGKTVWEGIVEVFDIRGHPNVRRGYGWQYTDDDGKTEYATVLGVVPINSPLGAVRAFIASKGKPVCK